MVKQVSVELRVCVCVSVCVCVCVCVQTCLPLRFCRNFYRKKFEITGITAQKLYYVKKNLKKNPHKVSSATFLFKRQTAKKHFPAYLASYTFTKMATKRTRVPTAILKITGFFF